MQITPNSDKSPCLRVTGWSLWRVNFCPLILQDSAYKPVPIFKRYRKQRLYSSQYEDLGLSRGQNLQGTAQRLISGTCRKFHNTLAYWIGFRQQSSTNTCTYIYISAIIKDNGCQKGRVKLSCIIQPCADQYKWKWMFLLHEMAS